MTETNMNVRAREAVAAYLERSGYEILFRDFECHLGNVDIVAFDEDAGCVVFADVVYCDCGDLSCVDTVTSSQRNRTEAVSAMWLAGYADEFGLSNMRVRFDRIGLLRIGDGNALLKHYVNAFGNASKS